MVDWKIGPTFPDEIAAAGISFEGWSWNIIDGTFSFNDDVPQATRDAVLAVYAVHDPTKQTVPPTPWPPGTTLPEPGVPRLTVIARLTDARLLSEFCDELDKSAREVREIWYATPAISKNDPLFVKLLLDAGADPAVILR